MLDEPYIPEEQIAAGPSGMVYRGHDLAHERTVRLKVLLENHVSCPTTHSSVHALRDWLLALRHPNIAGLLALDVSGDEMTLVSEFADGPNGWSYVQQQPLSARQVNTVMHQLLAALEKGESMRFHHGNLKPSNLVLFGPAHGALTLRVLDWGLAACRSHQPHETLAFRAPELFLGSEATARSDLFSAGAVVAALLLGRYPVMGLNEEALQAAWQRFDPEQLHQQRPDISAKWMDCLLQLLMLEPSQRPASAREAALQFTQAVKVVVPAPTLSALAQESRVASTQGELETRPSENASRCRQGSCLGSLLKWGILLIALLAGTVTWLFQQRHPTWPPQVNRALDKIEAAWQKVVKSTEEVLQNSP